MKTKVLAGKNVLITRPANQSKDLISGLESHGANPVHLPLIQISTLEISDEIESAFRQLDQINWLVFTSTNAVKSFFGLAEALAVKFYFFSDLKIATVGEKTKMQLEQLGYRTNFVPIEYTAKVLAENMDQDLSGKKILIPCSNKANTEYIKTLEKQGAEVQALTVYKNSTLHYSSEDLVHLPQTVDYITFASGSAVQSFVSNGLNQLNQFQSASIVCIGPSTKSIAEELGLSVKAIANPYTSEGMIETIKDLEHV